MGRHEYLLKEAIANVVGQSSRTTIAKKVVQAVGSTTSGSGAATIAIQVSNNNNDWIDAGIITLTLGTTRTTDGFEINASWLWIRAVLSGLSGTGANVSVHMGI